MVLWAVSHGCSAAAAWTAALWFLGEKRSRAAAVLIVALLCAGCSGGLAYLGLERWAGPAELAVFVLAAAVPGLTERERRRDALLALLLAQGGKALLDLLGNSAQAELGIAGAVTALLACAGWVGVCAVLSRHFPEENWRQVFLSVPAAGRFSLRAGLVDGLAAGLCLLLTGVCWAAGPSAGPSLLGWWILGVCLYWGGVILIALLIAFQKEQGAVLAEQRYREEMQSFLSVIRSQRHDYNFHVQTIAGLIQDGKIEECRQYVNALERDSIRMNEILPVQDPAIAAMIHNFRTLAAREGIDLQIDIQDDLSRIATNVYETNKILSNLLQNAIDEVSTHRDKSYGIRLTILKRGEYCVIRVSNQLEEKRPTAEQLGQIYQQGYSTKQGHDGVGLSSIKALAARYRGTIYTQLEGDVIHFVAKLPINYAKKPVNEGGGLYVG